jgi:hypothetical protein
VGPIDSPDGLQKTNSLASTGIRTPDLLARSTAATPAASPASVVLTLYMYLFVIYIFTCYRPESTLNIYYQ